MKKRKKNKETSRKPSSPPGGERTNAKSPHSLSGKWFLVGGLLVLTLGVLLIFPRPTDQVTMSSDNLQIPEPADAISDPAIESSVENAIEAVRQDIHSDQTWGVLGMTFLVHEFREEAQLAFSRASMLEPDSVQWRYLEAICFFPDDLQQGLLVLEAAERLLSASRSPDEQLAVQRRLANVYLESGQFEKAETAFSNLLSKWPDNEAAKLGLGQLRNQQSRFEEARTMLEQCESHPCTRKRAKQSLAVALQNLGLQDEAESTRREAIGLPDDMEWSDPFIALASKYRVGLEAMLEDVRYMMTHGRFSQASSLLDQLQVQYPQSHQGLFLRSDLQMRSGNLQEAILNLREGLRLNDQNHVAWTQLGLAYGGQQKLEQAIECFQKAIELSPSAGDVHFNLGFALMSLNRNDEALESFLSSIQFQPDKPEPYLGAAQVFENKRAWMKAREYLRLALEAQPGDIRAKLALERVDSHLKEGEDTHSSIEMEP